MVNESIRAILREQQGKPMPLRRGGAHTWIHGLPLKMRFKRSKITFRRFRSGPSASSSASSAP